MSLSQLIRRSCVLVAAAVVFGSAVHAQEEVTEPQEVPVIDLQGDAGVEVVQQAQQEQDSKFIPNQSAEETLQQFAASKNWYEGWDDEKKRYFVVSAQSMNVEEPAADSNFYLKRELLAKRAVLRAKAQIIQFIRTKMSASDRLTVPGTDVNAQLGQAFDLAEAKLRSQKAKIARLLREHSEAEAAALEGATTRDRIYALIDAAIKKLDSEYSSEKIEAKKSELYAKAKTRYAEAIKELADIQAQVEKFKGELQSVQSSDVSLLASMPLIGATVVQQTESWDESSETFQVAVLVCWSAKLEQAARAALTGEPIVGAANANESLTVQQWLMQQDLGQMVGPRQFLDASGQRWLIGITARPASRNAATDERNRELASAFASQMAAYSLFGDVDTQTAAKQVMKVLSTDSLERSQTIAAESIEQRLTQGFQNMQVQGLGRIAGKIAVHPLTGQKIYVVAYGISPVSARAAMALERQTMLAAIQVHKSQAFQKGRSKALQDAVNAAKNDPASNQAGLTKGKTEIGATKPAGKNLAKDAVTKPGKTDPSKSGKTKSGSTKPSDVKDDL